MPPTTLCINDVGPPVRACQDALHSALAGRAVNAQNGTYGSKTADDVAAFRADILRVPVRADGLYLASDDIDALSQYMDASRLAQLDKPLTTNVAYDRIMQNQGDAGPPIKAMQNALVSALGSEGRTASNARNGSYGSNTALDLEALAAAKHFPMPADGRGCSYLAWQLLLGYMNDANRANAGKPPTTDVKAGQWVFHHGDEGPPIEAMQAALASILGPGITQNARNGKWGSMTTADLLAARARGNLTPVGTGEAVDKLTWDWLYSYMNATYQAMTREPLTKSASGGSGGSGADVAASAQEALARLAGKWTYNQYRAMADSLWSAFAEDHSDCSSFATLVFKDAGCPDPNGRGYDGYGYTGSLWPRGTRCDPKPGALAFYGGSGGNANDTTHVAVCDTASTVISFGSTPMSKYSTRYRSDYRECRWYL